MSWTYVFLSSLVEGITEFIPVSSTGHLIILNSILKVENQDLISSFNIFIQSGAILAVLAHFFSELRNNKNLLIKIISAFIPTALIGFFLYPFIKSYLLDNITVVALALIVGGIVVLFLPKTKPQKTIDSLEPREAFIVGIFQAVSIIPGSSRALTSILGGLFTKLSLQESIKFSFFIAIPTILAATLLDLLKSTDLLLQQTTYAPHFLAGFILSFLVAKVVVATFLKVINQVEYFKYFGYYRVALGLALLLLL